MDGFTVFLTLLWLFGAAVWTVRAIREYRKLPKPERGMAATGACTLLSGASAAIWLHLGLSGTGGAYALPAGIVWLIVWLIGAVNWAVRAWKLYRQRRQKPDKTE